MRLDKYLHVNGFAQSRNKAQELIKANLVLVDDEVILKPSFDVEDGMSVKVNENIQYVSRAGDKLALFLQSTKLDVENKNCLDVGSSTGGFVEVLLLNDAKKVTAVDVGTDQLHKSLRSNPKISLHEQTDIRDFTSSESFDIVTCDVSFIGVSSIIEEIDRLANDLIIILFKPQFEVGKNAKRDSKGVVQDKDAVIRAKAKFETSTFALGWELLNQEESKIKGKEGNAETFYTFKKRRY